MLEKVEQFIAEINRIDREFFQDYFDTGKVEKINLKHTFTKGPTQPILTYRLNLHEAINDYLMRADVKDIAYFYRVKTWELQLWDENDVEGNIASHILSIKGSLWGNLS